MAIATTTHLNFRGQAREALTFYQSVFGGHLVAISYADAQAVQNETEADQIMWGQVVCENGFRIMAYDVPSSMEWDAGTIPMFVSVRGNDENELREFWKKLRDSATIVQPLDKAAWSPLYGMLKDCFGVTWALDIEVPNQA